VAYPGVKSWFNNPNGDYRVQFVSVCIGLERRRRFNHPV
jgi:hypothetical protein